MFLLKQNFLLIVNRTTATAAKLHRLLGPQPGSPQARLEHAQRRGPPGAKEGRPEPRPHSAPSSCSLATTCVSCEYFSVYRCAGCFTLLALHPRISCVAESLWGWLLAAGANKATVWVQAPSGLFTLLRGQRLKLRVHFWSRARGKGGGRPLREEVTPHGVFTAAEVSTVFSRILFSLRRYVFLEFAFFMPSASTHQAPVMYLGR